MALKQEICITQAFLSFKIVFVMTVYFLCCILFAAVVVLSMYKSKFLCNFEIKVGKIVTANYFASAVSLNLL